MGIKNMVLSCTEINHLAAKSLGFARISKRKQLFQKIPLLGENIHRYEWLSFRYDAIYDPYTAFHIGIHWLAATSPRVRAWKEKYIYRFAKKYLFHVAPIPCDQPLVTSDFFHVNIMIPLAPRYLRTIALGYRKKEFKFVKDSYEGDVEQYMHHTGMAIVRVINEERTQPPQ